MSEAPEGASLALLGADLRTVYPDSDKVAVWTGNADDNVIARRTESLDYWAGEASPGAAGPRPLP